VGQAGVAAELAVEDAGEQLHDGDQAHPGRHLLVAEPPGFHDDIVPPVTCTFKFLGLGSWL
jgi:hypothetical protein